MLFRIAFADNYNENREGILKYLQIENIDSSVFESMEAISKIIHGQASLETTLSNMGHLPTLDSQRFTVHDHCLAKLGEKFNTLDDENKLYMYLGLLMLRTHGSLNPFDNFKLITCRALQNYPNAVRLFNPPVMVLVTQTFSHMGILSNDQQPNIKRIGALAELFKSPLIRDYLERLKQIYQPVLIHCLRHLNRASLQRYIKSLRLELL